MRVAFLLGLLLLPAFQEAEVTVEGIPDPWPERERTAAQRFGMKTIENLPVPELDRGPGDQRNVKLESVFKHRSMFRVFGVKVTNPGHEPLPVKIVLTELGLEQEIVVPPLDWNKAYFLIESEQKREALEVKVYRKGELVTSGKIKLEKARTGTKWQASIIVDELRREMEFRLKWPRHPVRIETGESESSPLPEMSLTMLHRTLGLRVTAKTDARGVWTGRLLGGEWLVYARKEIRRAPTRTPSKDGGTTTEDRGAVDLYYLAGAVSVFKDGAALKLIPERHTPLRALDAKDAPILPQRYAIVPFDVGPALRYQLAHDVAAGDFILRCAAPDLEPTLHATANISFEIQAWAAPAANERYLYLEPKVRPEKEVVLSLKSREISRVRFDPASLAGIDRLVSTISMPEAARETYPIDTKEAMTVTVPSGLLRTSLRAYSGASWYDFSPEAVKLQGSELADLSPRNLQACPHWLDFRGLQVWACIMDSRERFITRVEKGEGKLRAFYSGKPLFEEKLVNQLTFHYPDQFKTTPYSAIGYSLEFKVGSTWVGSNGKVYTCKQFGNPPAFIIAPEKMKARAKAMIPMVQKTLAMCLERFGFAKLDQTIEVMIRMPPELPALAGGDRIILEMTSCLDYAHETDTFNRVYPHELGHNLGFGHDSYMGIAYHGCDEGLLGWPGYMLQVGRAPANLLGWLDRDRDSGEWSPSGDLYASMRMMYGPEAHKKMFEGRKRFDRWLVASGFSVEERIAAYYSWATDLNLGWMFRAHGWPVFDYRVNLALEAMRDSSLANQFKINEKIDGTFLTTWWMRGPIAMKDGKAESIPEWSIHAWPGRFLRLAEEDTVHRELAYHFYLTLGSDATRLAFLCVSTDSQVDVYLDGQRVTRVFAAPQKTQPAHDDYTLGRAQATRVPLLLHEGANAIELVVVKPAGSKGMFIELAGQDGKPVPGIGHALEYGPDERTKKGSDQIAHPLIPVVCNGGMEAGNGVPDAWIMATKDGDGNIKASLDSSCRVRGDRSLKLELEGAPVRGAVIQRCIVDEGGDYEFTGCIKTEGFKKGDTAFVMLFWGDPTDGTGWKSSDILVKDRDWGAFSQKWRADRRAVYVACVLRGSGGAKAWFDEIRLTRIR